MIELDHLAVAGETLAEAVAHVEDALGVAMQPGGHHDVFATHNQLLGLADGLYLEAIAVDPDAQAPSRPRWFDLDRFSGPARLGNWICRTRDLDGVLAGLDGQAGDPVALTRGDLSWQMAVPATGILPFDNLFPALIQWEGDAHPAQRLEQRGVRLRRLILCHPRGDELHHHLSGRTSDARLVIETGDVAMRAEFDTDHGKRVLE